MDDVSPDQLLANPLNARRHPAPQRDALRAGLDAVGWIAPVIQNRTTGRLIDGHARVEEALSRNQSSIPVCYVELTEEEERIALATLDRIGDLAVYDTAALDALLASLPDDLDDVLRSLIDSAPSSPFDDLPIDASGSGDPFATNPTLAERFLEPPFSVLDARSDRWQTRKAAWLSAGIDSGDGRDEGLVFNKGAGTDPVSRQIRDGAGGTSVFDPVVAELAYRWFSPPTGRILDPFAGGSVRGIVAARLGRQYVGVDLRPEQVTANVAQAVDITPAPIWLTGDSAAVVPGGDPALTTAFDMILSCPPYADLERYSDDPADLSNMKWPAFMDAYRTIIAATCDRLADNRFAVWVIGEVRDPRGHYRGLVPETVRAFVDAGLRLYNEAILVSPIGSIPVMTSSSFPKGRKLGKAHQNVLVFIKGDWRAATAACGDVQVAAEP